MLTGVIYCNMILCTGISITLSIMVCLQVQQDERKRNVLPVLLLCQVTVKQGTKRAPYRAPEYTMPPCRQIGQGSNLVGPKTKLSRGR